MPGGRPKKQLRIFGKANNAISEDTCKFIYRLSNTGDRPKVILEKCRHEGMKVGMSTIYRVLKERKHGKTRFTTMVEDGSATRRTVRTKTKISKVAKLINTPNPPTQKQIARKLGTSAPIVNQIIHQDLEMKTYKKVKVHRLNATQKSNRARNCGKLFEELSHRDLEFAVTLDETWIHLQDTNNGRPIFYSHKKGERRTIQKHDTNLRAQKMMVLVIVCRGLVKCVRIPANVKINSAAYKKILKKIFNIWLPKKYSAEEMRKVYFHHDKASAHTSKSTEKYLRYKAKAMGFGWIQKDDIPVKGCDVSPLDFWGFGKVKQALNKRRPTTMRGLWKAVNEEFNKIKAPECMRVMNSWAARCELVEEMNGEAIQGLKSIHSSSYVDV